MLAYKHMAGEKMVIASTDLEVRRWAAELIDDAVWNAETVSKMDPELLVERLCAKLAETKARLAEFQDSSSEFPDPVAALGGASAETLPNLLDAASTHLDWPDAAALPEPPVETPFERLVFQALTDASVVAFDWNVLTGSMRYTKPGISVAWMQSRTDHPMFADFCELIHVADREKFLSDLADALANGNQLRAEYRFSLINDAFAWVRVEARAIFDHRQANPHVVGILQDTTDYRRARADFEESEQRYRQLFDQAPVILAVFDRETPAILAANRAGCEHYGYTPEEVAKLSLKDLYAPEDWPRLVKALAELRRSNDESPYRGVWRHRKKSGEVFPVELRTTSVVFHGRKARLVVGFDVSEQIRAEEERGRLEPNLRQMQKLESLGVLAGGIAHDFNNLLTGILGNADLARSETTDSAIVEHLEQIEIAAHRAADLTRQLLAYSGKGRFIVQPIVLSNLVDEMAKLVEVSISKKVTLHRVFAANLPTIEVDVAQIRQVIMNLIINASEAHGDKSGEIVLRTGTSFCPRDYLDRLRPDEALPEQEYVWLEVTDSGCGMDESTQARIFDPFFTTKFAGRGLGLSAVSGIMRGHRGAVSVQSQPGNGTTIRVLFPIASKQQAAIIAAANDKLAWKGAGTILVVEDETSIRNLATTMLQRAGFTVLAAADGVEAVEIFKQRFMEIRATVLDMAMPRMDGNETFQEIRRIDPSAKVLLCSGFSEQEANVRFAGRDISGFIEKPYRSDQLLTALKAVLEVA